MLNLPVVIITFQEVLILATSSIMYNFILSDKKAVEGFIRAVEDSERECSSSCEIHSSRGRLAVDPQEILKITKGWRSKLKGICISSRPKESYDKKRLLPSN